MPPERRKKALVATCYALRRPGTKKWDTMAGYGSFANANLFRTRREASKMVKELEDVGPWEIVSCRVRPLSTRTKASPKRTR